MPIILPYSPHFAQADLLTQSITGSHTLTWDHFSTDNPEIFNTETSSPGDSQITLEVDLVGLLIATLSLHVDVTTWDGFVEFNGFGFFTPGTVQLAAPVTTPNSQVAQTVGWGGFAGNYFDAIISPAGGGTHTLESAVLIVQFWPKPFSVSSVY